MSLLQMSMFGAVLIVATVVLRAMSMNHLPKKTFLALWAIVILRLLLPFSVPSPLSAYTLVSRYLPVSQAPADVGLAAIAPAVPPVMDATINNPISTQVLPGLSPFSMIWGLGLVLCILFFAISYYRCHREFRESLPVLNEQLTGWLAAHKTVRPIQIRQSGRISAPLTYGICKPVILMPKTTNWDDSKQLDYILTHEFVHIKRFDAAAKLLLTLALCVHWFNPMVWIMYVLANRDIELSCDEAVVRIFGDSTKAAYARTLIGMEERKSGLTPLCNHFSRNAIEERITAIMKLKKTSVLAVLVAVLLISGLTVAFATSAASSPNSLQASDGKTFGEYERQRLNAFKFDGYEKMSVASYQQKAWVLFDTADYREVIERISQNNMLYKMRYNNNQDAAFLFNILEPLCAEKWQTRDFGGYTQAPNDDVQGDQAILEYQIFLTISDANRLTVGQYDKARQGMEEGLHNILQSKTNAELQNESTMDTAIRTEIAALKAKWQNAALQISVKYSFQPLSLFENPSNAASSDNQDEVRMFGPATKADYQSLLALKTPDYQSQPVAAFNSSLLDWANENYNRHERIAEDRVWKETRVSLTDEEQFFVDFTQVFSNTENKMLIASMRTGNPKEDPSLLFRLDKDEHDNMHSAFASLEYQLTYHIVDDSKLTVGARDQALAGVVADIQQYWDSMDVATLLPLTVDDMRELIRASAAKHSQELIRITAIEDRIFFESMYESTMRE